jgi:hypothetical protein
VFFWKMLEGKVELLRKIWDDRRERGVSRLGNEEDALDREGGWDARREKSVTCKVR